MNYKVPAHNTRDVTKPQYDYAGRTTRVNKITAHVVAASRMKRECTSGWRGIEWEGTPESK